MKSIYYNKNDIQSLTSLLQNIMKLTDGLFLQIATEVAKDYPQIEFNNMIVDNWYVQLLYWYA